MKRSLHFPLRVTGGRLVMTPAPSAGADPTALNQILALSLLDATSTNPWNAADDLGLRDPTFSSRRATEARVRARIRARFTRLERAKRCRLIEAALTWEGAELRVVITYESLETGDRQQLEVRRGTAA